MNASPQRELVDLFDALDPFLNSETRKSCHAVKSIFEMFPGMALTDVSKRIKATLTANKKSVPALAERARALINGNTEESFEEWLNDVDRLSKPDLKKLGVELEIEIDASDTDCRNQLRRWIESRGQVKPPTAKDRAEQVARRIAGDLIDRIRVIDGGVADEVIRKVDSIAKDKSIPKEVLEAFGNLLGFPVSGTKVAMARQLKDSVNRLARMNGQTKF